MATSCGGEPLVVREQSRIERFRKGNIDGVIGCEIVPQTPRACQKKTVRIPANRKVGQIGKSLAAAPFVECTSVSIAAENLRDFDVKEMRRVQGLPLLEKTCFHCSRSWRAKKDFQ